MEIVGIIAEYNPFHNGHIYHLEQVKKLFPDSLIVLVLSGCFTERGIPSVISKWDKTRLALKYGVDLVVELPYPFATQSADIFAYGALSLLNALGVNDLVFGSESNDLERLERMASIELQNDYQESVKKIIQQGNNYPTALMKALKEYGEEEISDPNDLLGITYIKVIKEQKMKIKPLTIARTSPYHDEKVEGSIASATAIRKALIEKKDVSKVVPKEELPYLQGFIPTMEDYFPFLKYQIIANSCNLDKFQSVDEGIDKRILKVLSTVNSYEELVQKVKSKRYTQARIQRMFCHILCAFTKEEAKRMKEVSYIRLLGFSTKGQKYLNKKKKEIVLPIITRYAQSDDVMLVKEKQVTEIYASCFSKEDQERIEKMEYQTPPIQS